MKKYFYIAENKKTNLVKLGQTDDPATRIQFMRYNEGFDWEITFLMLNPGWITIGEIADMLIAKRRTRLRSLYGNLKKFNHLPNGLKIWDEEYAIFFMGDPAKDPREETRKLKELTGLVPVFEIGHHDKGFKPNGWISFEDKPSEMIRL